ncbi:hypothetical protein [Clostridium arbusti]|uniref:hypothetical protein n=1 Tax=Clostridium arbusti TaxID=1137848 RepID=UPI000287B1F9|nr:hypothetical protein [Clostridium arbusti]
MGKIKVCKHTLDYDKLVKELKNNEISFEIKDCIHKCSKCREKVLVKKDHDYVSAKTVEKLVLKLRDEK